MSVSSVNSLNSIRESSIVDQEVKTVNDALIRIFKKAHPEEDENATEIISRSLKTSDLNSDKVKKIEGVAGISLSSDALEQGAKMLLELEKYSSRSEALVQISKWLQSKYKLRLESKPLKKIQVTKQEDTVLKNDKTASLYRRMKIAVVPAFVSIAQCFKIVQLAETLSDVCVKMRINHDIDTQLKQYFSNKVKVTDVDLYINSLELREVIREKILKKSQDIVGFDTCSPSVKDPDIIEERVTRRFEQILREKGYSRSKIKECHNRRKVKDAQSYLERVAKSSSEDAEPLQSEQKKLFEKATNTLLNDIPASEMPVEQLAEFSSDFEPANGCS